MIGPMTMKAKSPATRTTSEDQAEVRTAEDAPQEAPETTEEKPVEKDSLEDLVRRVERLETRIF